ncbi:hypothetical protein HYS79_02525 [Patescibacteria group bacterium]|nr:hypothetical protein [Patescibacteria group bacterium]
MDPQIEELKELVRQNITLSQETNNIVHGMRSAARWSRLFRMVWIVAILIASGAAYLYFAPYLEQIIDLYNQASGALEQLRAFGGQATNAVQNFTPGQ